MPPTAAQPLSLEPVAGPSIPAILAPPGKPVVIGRSASADAVIVDAEGVVSRRHAEVAWADGSWRITDLLSKHGTHVNGNKLTPGLATTLRDGDRVRIGPWTFRVNDGSGGERTHTRVANTQDDRGLNMTIVRRAPADSLAAQVQRKLELLMSCAATIASAQSEAHIARVALDALAAGAGFPRLFFLRPVGDAGRVEVVAARGKHTEGEAGAFSRSLLQAAMEGQTVTLSAGDTPMYGQSIMSLEIHSAICSPVMIDGACDALLYLDARGGEASPDLSRTIAEASAFCQAIGKLCGLAMSNLSRVRLEEDERRRLRELEAARDVQRIIMPPSAGSHAGLSYFVRCVPGRFVAGDLFDFFPIDEHRAAVLLGDVAGKGIAAGMVMSNVQAHLSRMLRATGDVAGSLSEANVLVSRFSDRYGAETGRNVIFLSLWAGVFDLAKGTLTYVDAGHGYALLGDAGGVRHLEELGGGPPIGADAAYRYEPGVIPFPSGSRLVVYSDGVAEQRPGPSEKGADEQYGVERTIAALRAAPVEPERQVAGLVESLRDYACLSPTEELCFADDVTVACVARS